MCIQKNMSFVNLVRTKLSNFKKILKRRTIIGVYRKKIVKLLIGNVLKKLCGASLLYKIEIVTTVLRSLMIR